MGEEKTEEKVLGLNVIVDFAMMYPEELHGIQRLGKLEWRFRIGVEGPGFWLRFHAISQSYTLDYFSLNSTQAANLVKTLKHVYLNELGKNIAACSPKFADFRKKLLGHFEVRPEREAGANAQRVVKELPCWMKNRQDAKEACSRRQMTATGCGDAPQPDGVTFNIDLR